MGRLLKRLRRQRGFSQEALAARAGYSVGYIGMLERGVRVAPPETVYALAAAIQATDEQLVALLALADGSREQRCSSPVASRLGAPFLSPPLTTIVSVSRGRRMRRARFPRAVCGRSPLPAWRARRVRPSQSRRCCAANSRSSKKAT